MRRLKCHHLGDPHKAKTRWIEVGCPLKEKASGLDPAGVSGPGLARASGPGLALTSGPDLALTSGPDLALTSGPDVALTSGPDLALTSGLNLALTSGPDLPRVLDMHQGPHPAARAIACQELSPMQPVQSPQCKVFSQWKTA